MGDINSKKFRDRIIVSLFICFCGVVILNIYNINIVQSIYELANSYEHLLGIISGSDAFINALQNTWLFENIYQYAEYEYTDFYLFFINSLFIQELLFFLYQEYMFKYSLELSEKDKKILVSINLIAKFFLVFISNYFCMNLLKALSRFLEYIYNNFFDCIILVLNSFNTNLIVQILSLPILVMSVIIMAKTYTIIIGTIFLSLLEFAAILVVYWLILKSGIDLKTWMPIFITIIIRTVIKYIQTSNNET